MGVGVRWWGRGFDDHENTNFLINIINNVVFNTGKSTNIFKKIRN